MAIDYQKLATDLMIEAAAADAHYEKLVSKFQQLVTEMVHEHYSVLDLNQDLVYPLDAVVGQHTLVEIEFSGGDAIVRIG